MIIDLDQQDSDPFKGRVFDICICGAGVAGITLALALSKNFNVLLLEAGGTEYSSESQLLYQGTSVGREYFPLLTTRLRFLGGTSNHWGGWCGTLDAHDFERKTYVEYSGWPIGFHDLEPYAGGARSILDVSEEYQSKPTASQLAFLDRIAQSGDFTSFDMLWSHPVTRFREKYKAEIEERPNLTCFVNPNLTRLTIVDNLTRVREAEVRNYHRREFKVSARRFVLATGGIENPRILLNCDDQVDGGIGNRRGLVGRFFCEHPTHTVGELIVEDTVRSSIADHWHQDRAHNYRFFAPSKRLIEEEGILNFGLRFYPSRHLGDNRFELMLREIVCAYGWTQGLWEAVRHSAINCAKAGVDGELRIATEQALNPSSRVYLGSELDSFGMRRPILEWQLSEIDRRTIQRAAVRFGETLARQGLGRVRLADWLFTEGAEFPGFAEGQEVGGHHHMCTTRMAESPSQGVVDKNQKVFGVDNLYLAGSSVFSTPGHINPTFTIVQMTLRLADYLNAAPKE